MGFGVCGSSAFEFLSFGHDGEAQHVLLGLVVFFDVGVEGGVGKVGFTAIALVVSALQISSVSSGHFF
jgi:hypothetical protein